MSPGLSTSVQVRLVRHAKAIGVDPNLILSRFAAERLLHRITRSAHADRFVLKGAMLMLAWLGESIRPTRDMDLHALGELDADALTRIFRDICDTSVERDGLEFDADSMRVAPIRPDESFGGWRVRLIAGLGPARIHAQVDVGIGVAVTPEPE